MSYRSKYHCYFGREKRSNNWTCNVRPRFSPWDVDYISASNRFLFFPGKRCINIVDVLSKTNNRETTKPTKISTKAYNSIDVQAAPFNDSVFGTSTNFGDIFIMQIPNCPLSEMTNHNESEKDTKVDFQVCHLRGHTKKAGKIGFHPTVNGVLVSASVDRTMKVWDLIKEQAMATTSRLSNVPLCFSFDLRGHTCSFTTRDKHLSILDCHNAKVVSRSKDQVMRSMKGLRCLNIPNRNMILVTGFERGASRTAKVFDERMLDKEIEVTELDLSAGIIMPFYDEDLGLLYLAGKGESMIRYFDTNGEKFFFNVNYFQSRKPQRGICMAPKLSVDTENHQLAKFYKLTNNEIVQLDFIFPRKSCKFQPDLYPDTRGFVATSTKDDLFLKNKYLEPVKKVSMRPDLKPMIPRWEKWDRFQNNREEMESRKDLRDRMEFLFGDGVDAWIEKEMMIVVNTETKKKNLLFRVFLI